MLIPLRGLTRTMTQRVLAATASASGEASSARNRTFQSEVADTSYEAAMRALVQLQSNAETVAKARQIKHLTGKKKTQHISRMLKFIERSGLTMEEIDKMSVIHVSGTKGKGSTCAFCERIFSCHGYKTGLFSSPHMVQVRERIRINGQPISQQLFSKYFWTVYNNLKDTQPEVTESSDSEADNQVMPAYFAFLTILSLHVFVKEGVDIAIMEVGIGGQYDSTNIFRTPDVCGVTSLGLDHTSMLGNTIEEIAWNKAGIFKPGCPAITVTQSPAALQVLIDRAKEKQNPIYVSKQMSREVIDKFAVRLGIDGGKQVENASLAVQLYRMWKLKRAGGTALSTGEMISSPGEIPQLEVTELDQATLTALAECRWPGRAQTLRTEHVTYFLDGAHTKESIEVCAAWFKEASDRERANHRGQVARVLLYNTGGDRDVHTFLAVLKTCHFDAAVFCPNQLSTVNAMNPLDQVNRTVTPRWMLERMKHNKSTWDSLVAADYGSNTTAFTTSSEVNSSHLSQADPTRPGDLSACIDHNSNVTPSQGIDHLVNGQEMEVAEDSRMESVPSKKLKLSDNQAWRVMSAPVVSASNGQSRWISHSLVSDQPAIEQNHQRQQKSINHTDQPDPRGQNDQSLCGQPPPSLTFPCILQALAWATQGRDPQVKVYDTSITLPDIPAQLRAVDHIHILVTGSLHLVGGVLGVIDPCMKE